jgi:membrane associated rhomboid family serine protease
MNAVREPELDRPRFCLARWSIGSAILSLLLCAGLGFTGDLVVTKYQGAPPSSQAILVVLAFGPYFAAVAALSGCIVGLIVGLIRRRRWAHVNNGIAK